LAAIQKYVLKERFAVIISNLCLPSRQSAA